MTLFHTCVSSCVLFATAIPPLSQTQIQSICIVQRKMLRRIVGWRQLDDEPCCDTMIRMNQPLTSAMQLHLFYQGEIQYADRDSVLRAILKAIITILGSVALDTSVIR